MQSLDLSQQSFFRATTNQWHVNWSLSAITIKVIISYIYNFSRPSSFPVGMLKILNLVYINRVKKLLKSQWWRFSGLPNINIFTEFKQQILSDFFLKFIFGCAGSSLLCGLFSSYGEWGLVFSCDMWASHCNGFSCCRATGPRCAGFSSCGTWAQCRCGSRALEHGLNSCGAWA